MNTLIPTVAQAHAFTIAANLEQFWELIDEYGQDITADQLRTAAEEAAEGEDLDKAERLRDLADWLDDYVGDNARGDLVAEWVSASLDVWVTMHWRADRTDVQSVTVLVSSGGPHAEVRWTGDSLLRVTVTYGSETIERSVECPPVAAHLELLAEVAEHSQRRL